MSDGRQLRNVLVPALLEHIGKFAGAPSPQPKDYSALLNRLCDEIVANMRNTIAAEIDDDELADNIANRFREQYAGMFTRDGLAGDLRQKYRVVHNRYKVLANERKQQDWATTWDYIKMFIWRTAQAIAFAGVILAAAYFAKQWNIPLPLLRMY